jgi:chemosensory pili system protein ChpA (sensor histidine kinase/response regulator)
LSKDYKLRSIHSFTKVLVVDGLLYVTKSLAKVLTQAGYFVMTASDELEAMDKFYKFSPDVITIGQRLHDISGLEFIRRIKTDIESSKVKIIFITSLKNEKELKYMLSLGIENFIAKPIDNDKLLNTLKELI